MCVLAGACGGDLNGVPLRARILFLRPMQVKRKLRKSDKVGGKLDVYRKHVAILSLIFIPLLLYGGYYGIFPA